MTSSPVQRLSVLGLALTLALVSALAAFLWVILALYVPNAGAALLRTFSGFLWFTISVPGAFLLAALAFIKSFVLGAVIAMLYNMISGAK